MLLVELVQQPEPAPLGVVGALLRRLEIDDRAAGVADLHALVRGRHVAVAPVRRAVDRPAAMIREDDEAGQVLVLAPQPVGNPAADARMAGEDAAGVHLEQRWAVRGAERMHRADERDVVDVLGDVRKELRDLHAALAVPLEPPRRRHQAAGRPHRCPHSPDALHRLALVFEQGGSWVEGIDLADAAVAEDRDHRLGLGGDHLRLGRQRSEPALPLAAASRPLLPEQIRQREAGDAAAKTREQIAPRDQEIVRAGRAAGRGDIVARPRVDRRTRSS